MLEANVQVQVSLLFDNEALILKAATKSTNYLCVGYPCCKRKCYSIQVSSLDSRPSFRFYNG